MRYTRQLAAVVCVKVDLHVHGCSARALPMYVAYGDHCGMHTGFVNLFLGLLYPTSVCICIMHRRPWQGEVHAASCMHKARRCLNPSLHAGALFAAHYARSPSCMCKICYAAPPPKWCSGRMYFGHTGGYAIAVLVTGWSGCKCAFAQCSVHEQYWLVPLTHGRGGIATKAWLPWWLTLDNVSGRLNTPCADVQRSEVLICLFACAL